LYKRKYKKISAWRRNLHKAPLKILFVAPPAIHANTGWVDGRKNILFCKITIFDTIHMYMTSGFKIIFFLDFNNKVNVLD